MHSHIEVKNLPSLHLFWPGNKAKKTHYSVIWSNLQFLALQCRLECEPGYVAQRTPLITCVNGEYAKGCHYLSLSHTHSTIAILSLNWFQIWSPDCTACIRCKFGYQVKPNALSHWIANYLKHFYRVLTYPLDIIQVNRLCPKITIYCKIKDWEIQIMAASVMEFPSTTLKNELVEKILLQK